MNFSVVVHKNGRELGRSVGMPFEKALQLVKSINKNNQDYTWNAANAYVEETRSVKHLPMNVQ